MNRDTIFVAAEYLGAPALLRLRHGRRLRVAPPDDDLAHGAEQLVLTTPQLLPCNHKGAIRCRLS